MTVDAVLWDYDGTLVDTRRADEEAVTALVMRHPEAAAGVDVFWAAEGEPIRRRIERAWPEMVEEVVRLFDTESVPRVFPGVRATLQQLRRRGVAMGVVSSRRVEPLRTGLRRARLRTFFPVVVGLETVHVHKPDPEGLLLALRLLGAEPPRSVYVGDLELDVEAGRRAGVTTWRAAWSRPPAPGAAREPRDLLSPRETLERLDAPDAATG